MRNDNRSSLALIHQLVECALYYLFTFVVERGGRLVEKQDRRVLDQRPAVTSKVSLSICTPPKMCAAMEMLWRRTGRWQPSVSDHLRAARRLPQHTCRNRRESWQ